MSTKLHKQCHFTRQLATLVAAGLPLLQALESIANSEQDTDLQTMMTRLCGLIENGSSFHQALAQTSDFDTLYIALVGAAEIAGNLDEVLERLAVLLEKRQAIHAQFRSALTYPSAILVISVLVVCVIMVWVVPVFEGIFASLGAELPMLTMWVVGFSRWFSHGGVYTAVVFLASGSAAISLLMRNPQFDLWRDTQVLRVPVVGHLVHNMQLTLWTLTLSDLLKAGVPMLDALEVVAASSANRLLGIATIRVRTLISHGISLADALARVSPPSSQFRLFPVLLIQLVAVGEQSGSLDTLLAKLARQLGTQVDHLLLSFTQLLEPTLMAILGLLMGGLVVALYLPVFQMGQMF